MKSEERETIRLNTMQELLQIGAARASDALRMFIKRPTSIRLTSVLAKPVDRITGLLWPLDLPRIVVYVPIRGTMGGHFFIVMDTKAAASLAKMGGVSGDGEEMRISFFEEVANVVANNYLRSIEPYVGSAGQQDIPSCVEGLPEAIFDGIISELGVSGGTARIGRTECAVEEKRIDIEFWWFFDPGELVRLWERVDGLAGGKNG